MAKDVETAFLDILAGPGGTGATGASDFVAGLKTAGRYQADVY
jgi:sulfite reductase (NADPH) flavoprotein alpha-component